MNEHQREYIKLLTNSMYDIQKVRIGIGNRIDAFLRIGGISYQNMADEMQKELAELSQEFEKRIEGRIATAVKSAKIMEWLKLVKGIGPRYSGILIGVIGEPPETVSKLWALCGQGVIPVCQECNKIVYWGDEKAYFLNKQVERRWEQHIKKEEGRQEDEEDFKRQNYILTEKKLCQCEKPDAIMMSPNRQYYKGLLLDYNPFLKTACWKISGQFVKQGKFYRTIYEQEKERYTARDGDNLSPRHIDNRARRATVKLFLSHLWEMWRKSLGLSAGEFYLQNKLGAEFNRHHTYIAPPYADIFD